MDHPARLDGFLRTVSAAFGIHCARGDKDERPHVTFDRSLQKVDGSNHVDIGILDWPAKRVWNTDERSVMVDCIETFRSQELPHTRRANIHFHHANAAGNVLTPSCHEGIEHNDLVSTRAVGFRNVRANESGTTGNEHFHGPSSSNCNRRSARAPISLR